MFIATKIFAYFGLAYWCVIIPDVAHGQGTTVSTTASTTDRPTCLVRSISAFKSQEWFSSTSKTLSCSFNCNSQIKWYKDSLPLFNKNIKIAEEKGLTGVVTSTVTFENITLGDSGNYSCIGESSGLNDSSEGRITVYSKISFVDVPMPSYSAMEGENLTLHCSVHGKPLPVIVWKLNGETILRLNDSNVYQVNEKLGKEYVKRSSLHFIRMKARYSGIAECTTVNTFSQRRKVATRIFVFDQPIAENITIDPYPYSLVVAWSVSKSINESAITRYVISYQNTSTTVVESFERRVVLKSLLPSTTYKICVTPESTYGVGKSACQSAQTSKGYHLGALFLTMHNKSARTITLRVNRSAKLDKVDPSHYITIEYMDKQMVLQSEKARALKGTHQTFTFSNLQPYTSYEFFAYETIGSNLRSNKSNSVNVTTLQDAPSAPRNLQGTKTRSDSLEIKWDAPKFLNGIITHYEVKYSYVGDRGTELAQIIVNTTSCRISGLYPFVTYTILVFAKTAKLGPPVNITLRTATGTPQGKPRNIEVKNINSTAVNVSWLPPPQHLQGGILTEYKVTAVMAKLETSSDGNKTYVPANTTFVVFNGLKPYTLYKYSVAVQTNAFGPAGSVIHLTMQGVPSAPRQLIGEAIRREPGDFHSIKLSWQRPTSRNGIISKYQVVYWKTGILCKSQRCRKELQLNQYYNDTVTFTETDSERSHTIGRQLDPFSVYVVKVREGTVTGWGAYSDSHQFKTKPGRPSPPLNLTATGIKDLSFVINWDKPLRQNGIITEYSVETYSGGAMITRDLLKIKNGNEALSLKVANGIEQKTTYKIKIFAKNELEGYTSNIILVTTLATPAKFPWMFVLIGCLGVVLLFALAITIYLLVSRHRAKYKEVKTTEDLPLSSVCRSKPIPVSQLKQYCTQQHANSDHGFQQEYESMKNANHSYSWEHSKMAANQNKNRYSNIVAYDHSRVVLSVIENNTHSDYINANFIDGYKAPNRYIAAQGPLPETVLDFWRMVWEQQTSVIVMLTKLVEDNRPKCEQYWPEGKGLQYREIVVTVKSVKEMTDYSVRVFSLHKINEPEETREVWHYHFTAWPDHGVPTHPSSLLSFTRHVMSGIDSVVLNGPIIVHCSAGVGRTGTFIAIESCLRQIEAEGVVDVLGFVWKMRQNRILMVQVEAQYTFIYDALLDSVVCGKTEILPADIVSKINVLRKENPNTGETYFAAEFKRLESGISTNEKNQYGDASQPENKQKNRFLNILPYDKNRVKLVPIAGCRQSDYINASIIDGFQQKSAFIATQAPLENTVNDFWRMVLEQNVHVVVMLTKLQERGQEKCYLYWPQAGTVAYGSICVEVINVFNSEDKNLHIHDLRLTNRETGRSWNVTHYMYVGWPEYGSPDSGTELIHLIGMVQQSQTQNSNSGPILVHCSGGVGRTGVFISVFNSIERLKAKDVVDIFQTTRALRLQRTAMVQTVDQYMFCYQALVDYLNSFHLYVNTSVVA